MESVSDLIPILRPYAGESGTCSEEDVFKYLNLAMSLVWNKSDSEKTTAWYEICCVDGCITLPSEIKQIRLAWKCGHPISIGNEWYTSIPQIGNGNYNRNNSCWNKFVQMGNQFVTFQDYTLGPYNIRLMPENKADTGVEITVHAINEYGTKVSETIILGTAPETTDGKIMAKAVIGITKPKTAGRVRLYAYDPSRNYTLLLAVYQPYDLNPSFRRFASGGYSGPMTIFAKKKYIPVDSLTDLVPFTAETLIHAIQAVVFREDRNNEGYLASLALAIQEINRETADNEIPTGSPLRIFSPERVESLNPMTVVREEGIGLGLGSYW